MQEINKAVSGTAQSVQESMLDEKVDIEQIMASIRAEVKQGLSQHKPRLPDFGPPAAKLLETSTKPVLYSEELNYLNANWNTWAVAQEISSHRPGIGWFIVKFKNAVRNLLWNSLLKHYFEREREFQMQLVRHLNASARYIDARDKEIFWQLVEKLDNDIKSVIERGDRLFDELSASLAQGEQDALREFESLRGELRSLSGKLDRIAASGSGS